MAAIVHLVRHGEVDNPDHIVYADLQHFVLSELGEAQASDVADLLAGRQITAVCSSPLTRALQTAGPVAARHGLTVEAVDNLIEWHLSMRWSGVRWEDLPERFPGELEAYLNHPWDLPGSPETLQELAGRMSSTIRDLHRRHRVGELVVVSHQDPIQAARLDLTGRSLRSLWDEKPVHAEVISLLPGEPWMEVSRWRPPTQ